MKGSFEVLEGGMLTTIQDSGRVGYRKYGVPVSGVMDSHAYKLANWLVGNPADAPVLEITLQGGKYKFRSEAVIGITGAEMDVKLNGEIILANQTTFLKPGDELLLGKSKAGCRTYLAIKGEWNLDKKMGSYATCLAANFGGLEGRSLQKGDTISWNATGPKPELKVVPKELVPHFSSRIRIRVIPGPEWNWLSEDLQHKFLSQEFEISSQSNRMGIRLRSSNKVHPEKSEIKSSPVLPGIIQLPANGNPIVLMKDAQSAGGYPRIAKVIEADLWRLGQVWPPVSIRFELIEIKEAKKLNAFHQNIL